MLSEQRWNYLTVLLQVVTMKVAYICTAVVWVQAVLITLWPWFERLNPWLVQ